MIKYLLVTGACVTLLACNNAQQPETGLVGAISSQGVNYALVRADHLLETADAGISTHQTYVLRISREDGHYDLLRYNLLSDEEYYTRVYYYAYEFTRDVFIMAGSDTVYCALSHFERNYGKAPFINQLLSFEFDNIDPSDATRLVVTDRAFSSDPIYFDL